MKLTGHDVGAKKELNEILSGESEPSLAPKFEGKAVWKSYGQSLW